MDFAAYLKSCQIWVNAGLSALLVRANTGNDRIREAMAYATLAEGKRLRPLLVRATCEALGGEAKQVLPAACAVELIHTYSLIHDDLPAMDNDDLRRGRPACHRAFDEATAILAGDALLTLAFEVIADHQRLSANIRLEQSVLLAKAAGYNGMISGQASDMQGTGTTLTLEQLKELYQGKTSALIRSSCVLGALAAGANQQQIEAFDEYAATIGLAFQIQDDILDVTATAEDMGKTQGSDIARGKNTYVSLLGLEGAQREASNLHCQALAALDRAVTGEKTIKLRALAAYIVERHR